jgi:hypothetical protein
MKSGLIPLLNLLVIGMAMPATEEARNKSLPALRARNDNSSWEAAGFWNHSASEQNADDNLVSSESIRTLNVTSGARKWKGDDSDNGLPYMSGIVGDPREVPKSMDEVYYRVSIISVAFGDYVLAPSGRYHGRVVGLYVSLSPIFSHMRHSLTII